MEKPLTQPANAYPPGIRPPRPRDQAFVASTWVRSMLRRGSSYRRSEAQPIEEMVNAILDRDDTRILVRHSATNEDEIRGWCCYAAVPRVPVVHWAYVRKDYRERGYARSLLEAVGVTPRTAAVYTAMPMGLPGRKLIAGYPLMTMLTIHEFMGETK